MSSKQVCMLCNTELISLVQPPAEYGYLCANCKVAVLKVGKNEIDEINSKRQALPELLKLDPKEYAKAMSPIDLFGYGKQAFPADLVQQQRLYNDISTVTMEDFERDPIIANQYIDGLVYGLARSLEVKEDYEATMKKIYSEVEPGENENEN